MSSEIEEKLAGSLTAETTELLPFLPYLLQDFWALGSDPGAMIELIEKHVDISEHTRVLDLACGKGAVSVKLAQTLRISVDGFDLIPAFTTVAARKAEEYNVGDLCKFAVADISEVVKREKDYDIVILGAVGDVLGSPAETLDKLKATVKTGGYILIDEGYLPDGGKQDDVQYSNYAFLTETQWHALFEEVGLELIETVSAFDLDETENLDSTSGMAAIRTRANELIEKHPDKREIFEGYIRSQQNEYDDLDNNIVSVTWMLRKR